MEVRNSKISIRYSRAKATKETYVAMSSDSDYVVRSFRLESPIFTSFWSKM